MSLENLLVHKDGALIIDMGMCLLIPDAADVAAGLASSLNDMSVNDASIAQAPNEFNDSAWQPVLSRRGRPRQLMLPQGTCGKWIYMSPELGNYQVHDLS